MHGVCDAGPSVQVPGQSHPKNSNATVAKPAAAPTKEMATKSPVIKENLQKRGVGPMSVGGPAKATKGTGVITGTAGAHKH